MSTQYEKEIFEVWGANEIKAIDYPGRCSLTKVSIVAIGTGAIAADIYNRLFTGLEHDIDVITDEGGFVKITLTAEAKDLDDVIVGDMLEVTNSATGAYNVATHRITSIADDLRSCVTSESFSADALGGEVKLQIPAAEQPAYQVLPQITGTDDVLELPGTVDLIRYVNKDPLGNRNIGVNRKLYLKFADASTYRVLLGSTLSVAGEG
jgi:hypothetical protein